MKTLSNPITCNTRAKARLLASELKKAGYQNIITPTSKTGSGWLVGATKQLKKKFVVVNNKAVAA